MRNSKVVKKMENLLDPYFQRQQTAVVDVYRILINTYMETEHDEFHLVIEQLPHSELTHTLIAWNV